MWAFLMFFCLGIRDLKDKNYYLFRKSPRAHYPWHYFSMGKSTFRYDVREGSKTEVIYGNGPIKEPLLVQVFSSIYLFIYLLVGL